MAILRKENRTPPVHRVVVRARKNIGPLRWSSLTVLVYRFPNNNGGPTQ